MTARQASDATKPLDLEPETVKDLEPAPATHVHGGRSSSGQSSIKGSIASSNVT